MSERSTTTWLLLRGLMRESAHWGDFPEALQRALPPGAQVITLDFPGTGVQRALRSPGSIASLTDWCRSELKRRGVHGPVHVLAMSMGAMVATEWAYQAPQELAAAVLINTSFAPLSPFYHRLRPRNYLRLLRLVCWYASPLVWEWNILEMTSQRPAERAGVLPQWVLVRQQRPVRRADALRQLLAAARYRVREQAPAVPLLMLASACDGLVDSRCTQLAAQRWTCALRLHPWAGHDLPLDDPAWVVTQVRDWVSSRFSS